MKSQKYSLYVITSRALPRALNAGDVSLLDGLHLAALSRNTVSLNACYLFVLKVLKFTTFVKHGQLGCYYCAAVQS